MLDKEEKISEGHAGFRPNRSRVDNVYTLANTIQGSNDTGLTTSRFFLDVQKVYDTVWRNGFWEKMWETGTGGKMWRMVKKKKEYAKRPDARRGNVAIS